MDIEWKLIFALIAMCISVCNLAYYTWSVFYKGIRPHAYTWLIWGIVTVIAVVAQYQAGGGYAFLHLSFVAFACFTICILGFWKGKNLVHRNDKICLSGCLVAIGVWLLTGNPFFSVLLITLIDLSGFYPTIRKSWDDPHNENIVSFFFYGLCFTFQIMAIENYNFLTTFYSANIALASFALVIYLYIRRTHLKRLKGTH